MVKKKIIKLSFVGDIMCEKPLLKAAKMENSKYDFDEVFTWVKKIFQQSDYVVGNLETVFAGKDQNYTDHIYNFNTPDEFIESLKNSGIDMVTTANNHCLDRGISGLERTNFLLDKFKIDHIGTYNTIEESKKIFIKDINGIRIAFLSYTYGTNTQVNKFVLDEENKYRVNLLQPQTTEIYNKKESQDLKKLIFKYILKLISVEQWIRLKKILKMQYNHPRSDDRLDNISSKYLERIRQDIGAAKSQADCVIMCMHSGGQFNEEPGEFSKYMMNFMADSGVDAVIGTHPHIVQRHEMINGMLGVYSLGNFNISPSSVYIISDGFPDYGIILHLYINKYQSNIGFERVTFTIIKMVENKKGYVTVQPVKEIIEKTKSGKEKETLIKNNLDIYNRFLNTNLNNIRIQEEYEIDLERYNM